MHALQSSAVVAVIGAGAMGAGIAQVAARAGHPVKLYDNRPGVAAQAVAGIDRQLGRLVEKGKLQPDARAVMALRYQEDLDPTDIAALLDMPLSTVKSHLRRSLEWLRTQCAGEHHGS